MRILTSRNRWMIRQLISSFKNSSNPASATCLHPSFHSYRNLLGYASPTECRCVTVLVLIGSVIAAALVSVFSAVLILAISALGVLFILKRRAARRSRAIEHDLPALITVVASSVRASVDPLTAICEADQFFAKGSPLVEEIQLLKQRLVAGQDEREVLEAFLHNEGNRDVELFKHSILLSRKHGGSLAEPLHRIVRVVRQRQSFRRKTRAALAMHRMSVFGIMLCAVFISLMQVAVNLPGVQTALADPRGAIALGVGLTLIIVGGAWMSCMGREEKL